MQIVISPWWGADACVSCWSHWTAFGCEPIVHMHNASCPGFSQNALRISTAVGACPGGECWTMNAAFGGDPANRCLKRATNSPTGTASAIRAGRSENSNAETPSSDIRQCPLGCFAAQPSRAWSTYRNDRLVAWAGDPRADDPPTATSAPITP